MLSGTAGKHVFITVASYHPDHPNSNDGLQQDLSSALNDFLLTATQF